MATAQAASRPAGSAGGAARFSLKDILKTGTKLPGRYVAHGVEGIGKTSFGAMTPNPIFVQTRGETGLDTLIDAGRLGDIDHFPAAENWNQLRGIVETLTNDQHDFKTLVLDTTNGAERLCHEHVCAEQFGGEWGDKGFASYQKGYDVATADWRILLNDLDRLREKRLMTIVLMCHTKVAPFKNPEGADFDRYTPDMHHKTWSLTHKWADAVLFMNFETLVQNVDKKGEKGKGAGGQRRVMYTERHAAYDAKNRYGLPEIIDLGDSPQEAWSAFAGALKAARSEQNSNGKDG